MNGPILYFDNGAEDVGAFPLDTLSAVHSADQVINLYFGSTTKHKVVLATADAASGAVAKLLCEALSPSSSFNHNKLVTVADETRSTYLVAGIIGVTSIGIDVG